MSILLEHGQIRLPHGSLQIFASISIFRRVVFTTTHNLKRPLRLVLFRSLTTALQPQKTCLATA